MSGTYSRTTRTTWSRSRTSPSTDVTSRETCATSKRHGWLGRLFEKPTTSAPMLASPVRSARRPLRLSFEQLWLPMVAAKLGADLIHSAGYTAPLISTARRVASILDMNYKRHPEDLSVAERCVYSILIPLVARQSHHVITLSGAAREDIVRWTSVDGSKITAIPLAPRAMWPGDPRDDHARLDAAGVAPPYLR